MTISVSKQFKVVFTKVVSGCYQDTEINLAEDDVNILIEKLKNVKKEKGVK